MLLSPLHMRGYRGLGDAAVLSRGARPTAPYQHSTLPEGKQDSGKQHESHMMFVT